MVHFCDITEQNFKDLALIYYDNPQCFSIDEFYDDAEKGYIDKDEYLEYLKSFIFERKYYNEIQFYKPVIQQSKIKIYLQNLINKIKIWKGR